MTKYWKIILPLLFALAMILGIWQRPWEPYLQGNKNTFYSKRIPTLADKTLDEYYQEMQGIRGQMPTNKFVTFLAVGDISLGRNVAATIKKSGNPLLPFSGTETLLKSTDFNFGNLESPLSGSDYFNSTGSLVFNAPPAYALGLKEYNFQILNLANNHALDQGLKGLKYTKIFLDDLKILHVGIGDDIKAAWQPAVVEAKGIKICFIGASYSSLNDNGKTTNNYVARIEDIENLKLQIENSKSLCDFVVATMHAGTEYTRKPNQAQIDFAHAAIDDGADMVIGAHPHWVQTIERYCPRQTDNSKLITNNKTAQYSDTNCSNPKYIFYSLGNFIFDQMWSRETREGLALKIILSKKTCHPERATTTEGSLKLNNEQALRDSSPSDAFGLGMTNAGACTDDIQGGRLPTKLDSIELIPVIIENYSTPRLATEDETKKILDKIGTKEKILK